MVGTYNPINQLILLFGGCFDSCNILNNTIFAYQVSDINSNNPTFYPTSNPTINTFIPTPM